MTMKTTASKKEYPTLSGQEKQIGWNAPSNIALIKYWGKREHQLPANASLSISLENTSTTTYLTLLEKRGSSEAISMEYNFPGEVQENFQRKMLQFLTSLLAELPFLSHYRMVFHSENNFPHSSGIASSASSMAAMALCLVSFEEWVSEKTLETDVFYRRASGIARLGSGSACRSVYGGMASWGATPFIQGSSDLFATRFLLPDESHINRMHDLILIVDSAEKRISSSKGHSLMKEHPYRKGRRVQAISNLQELIGAIQENDYRRLAAIAELEALSLHALLISSHTDGMLLQPETLHIIREIKQFRDQTGLNLFFTLDAGPNVHLIHFEDQRELVIPFVKEKLLPYCEKGSYLDDKIGAGPKLLTEKFAN